MLTFFGSSAQALDCDGISPGTCLEGTVKDKYGSKTGTIKKNYDGSLTIKDKYGSKTGTIKKNYDGSTTITDKYGNKEAVIK